MDISPRNWYNRAKDPFISQLEFSMSFNVCIESHDEVVDGLPSLALNTKTTTNSHGMQVINGSGLDMTSRRICQYEISMQTQSFPEHGFVAHLITMVL